MRRTSSGFARRLNVEPAAVSLWISRQKLTAPALREDGTIDVKLAVEQLRERLEHARSDTDLERALLHVADDEAGDGGPATSTTAALIERQRAANWPECETSFQRKKLAMPEGTIPNWAYYPIAAVLITGIGGALCVVFLFL